MQVVVGSTLDFAALVEVVIRHTFNGTSLFLLCSCLRFRVGFIKLKWIFSMYQ